MKLAVISDIHDNLVNLKKCLSWCDDNAVGQLICCGDVTNSETLGIMAKDFKRPIHLVRGNLEIYNEREVVKYKNIIYYGRVGVFEVGNKIIGLCHEPYLIPKVSEIKKCDIIFYGHTHKPWEHKPAASSDQFPWTVNPGTLGGVFQKATFAVYDTEKNDLELKILELL